MQMAQQFDSNSSYELIRPLKRKGDHNNFSALDRLSSEYLEPKINDVVVLNIQANTTYINTKEQQSDKEYLTDIAVPNSQLNYFNYTDGTVTNNDNYALFN